jgi:metabolite-proton symporter
MVDIAMQEARGTLVPKNSYLWIAGATMIGTTIEWFDFFIYGTAAALVFNKLFFPSFDTTTATLASLATFSIGLFFRPLGGLIFGHFGDRVGRKSMLMSSLLLMGIPTVLIGLVPTYESIGLWAAAILVTLRVLQGIALGGEWGGAVLMAVEHAPRDKASLFGSLPQAGVPAGLLLAAGAFALLGQLSERDFLTWGWRMPFVASFVLVIIGLLVRSRIAESPVFAEIRDKKSLIALPAATVVRSHLRSLMLAVGAKLGEVTLFYVITVFVLSYATTTLGFSRGTVLQAIMIAAALALMTIPLFGWIGDRAGQRTVYFFGAVLLASFAVPMFALIETRSVVWLTVSIVTALGIIYPLMYGPQPSLYSAQFPPEVRYSGISLGVQLAGAIGGGLAPIVATSLLVKFGNTIAVGAYLGVLGIVAGVCVYFMKPASLKARTL